MEALQVGHLAIELCKLYLRIYLIGEQDRLLFHHSALVGTDLDEEFSTAISAAHTPAGTAMGTAGMALCGIA